MRRLPLFTEDQRRAPIEKVTPLDKRDPGCTRCALSQGARTVCMGVSAQINNQAELLREKAVLVLGSYPTAAEDDLEVPFSGGPGSHLREYLKRIAPTTNFVFANAVRCAPRLKTITRKVISGCAGYTAGLIQELKPERILCLGKQAYRVVLGEQPDSVQLSRKAYGYLSDSTPVFMLHEASRAVANHFLLKQWEEDLAWALTTRPRLPPWDAFIDEVETPEDAELAVSVLRRGFTYDTETAGLMGESYFQVLCLTATPRGDDSVTYLWTEEAIKNLALVNPLRMLLADSAAPKTGHHLKYDFKAVGFGLNLIDPSTGILQVRNTQDDTMLTAKAADTESKSALAVVDNHVGMGGHKKANQEALRRAVKCVREARLEPDLLRIEGFTHPALAAAVRHPEARAEAFAYALVDRPTLYRYCALDTVATNRVADLHDAEVYPNSPSLSLLRDKVLRPATFALAQIEAWGMSASRTAADLFGGLLRPKLQRIERDIVELGCTINVRSQDQLADYLFGKLGLPPSMKTETGKYSVQSSVLEKLKDRHPIIPLLLEHATLSRLLSTYVDGLKPFICEDGRIHTNLNMDVARTGRLSCSQPNLQNIPSSGDYAKQAKNIFNAPPGHVLIQLDYSQLEVRVAAILSGDKKLAQSFRDGVDVHRRTAAQVFRKEESEVTVEERRAIKAVVFSILYGKQPNTLAKELGIPFAEAQQIYDSVLGALPELSSWMREQRAYVRRTGTVQTYTVQKDESLVPLRTRQLWYVAGPNPARIRNADNSAVNTPVQGSASDIMLQSIVRVVDWLILDRIPARATNTVHDSLLVEAPFDWAWEVALSVKDIMEDWPSRGVPLKVDVEFGLSWGAMMTMEDIELVWDARRLHDTAEDAESYARERSGKDATWYREVAAMADRLGLKD